MKLANVVCFMNWLMFYRFWYQNFSSIFRFIWRFYAYFMRVFDCCTRIHFKISTHRSHNKSCAHQFPLTHKANVDVKFFPYSIQATTTWSKFINSLSDFFLFRTFDEMKMFTFRKWIRFWFLGNKTIACKMVSALSPCKQSLSFSQSLCKYFSLYMTLFSNLFCLFSKIDSVAQRTIIRREFEVCFI